MHEAGHPFRPAPAQPHVHWTLVHDLVRIVGLWANHPEGGQFAPEQLDWFVHELADTPDDTVLIVALHQPVYSADITHGSNLALVDLLDACATRAGRFPDAVFSGHAHLYQRFTHRRDGRAIPHIVAGAGGYPQLHPLAAGVGSLPASFAGVPGVTLDHCEDSAHGFMTVTAERRARRGRLHDRRARGAADGRSLRDHDPYGLSARSALPVSACGVTSIEPVRSPSSEPSWPSTGLLASAEPLSACLTS